METDDDFLIAKRFGIFGKVIFLIEGSQSADLAKGIKALLEIHNNDNLNQDMIRKLSNSEKKLVASFEAYRQDYFDDPNEKERVHRFKVHLKHSFLLADELKGILEEFREISTEHEEEISNWLDAMFKTIEDILNRYDILQTEFSE